MLIYLASPYTHMKEEVRVKRYEEAARVAGKLMDNGYTVYSPIAHSHPIEHFMDGDRNHDFWMRQCIDMLRRCDALYVLAIDGWDKSKGVQEEIAIAQMINMPILMISSNESADPTKYMN